MLRLISYVSNLISWSRAGTSDCFTVSNVGNVLHSSMGTGLLYFWTQKGARSGTSYQFDLEMRRSNPVEVQVNGRDELTLVLESKDKFSCSGIISMTGDGYIIAPSIKLETKGGREIVFMLLLPVAEPLRVSVDKTVLNIPESSETVAISTEAGEVRCSGTLSSRFKTARLLLTRNPDLPIYRKGFDEELAILKAPGELVAVWKPVMRQFQERLLVFDPFNITRPISEDLKDGFRDSLEEKPEEFFADFVVGDGSQAEYAISLVLDHGLRRYSRDTARILVV